MGPSYKNPIEQVPPPNAERPAAPAFTAQGRGPEARLADPLAEARKGLSYAFRAAEGAIGTLNEDQVKILESLRENPSVETLNQVVYRDEATGQEYRAQDYLTAEGNDSRVAGLPSAVRAYEAALAKANGPWGAGDLADQYRRQWATAQDQAPFVAKNRSDWREYNQRPEVAAGLAAAREQAADRAVGEAAGWVDQLQADWKKYNQATAKHLEGIKRLLDEPMKGAAAYAALEANQRQPAAADRVQPAVAQEAPLPVLGALPPLPGQPGYDEMMAARIQTPNSDQRLPEGYAGPNEKTVVMPVAPAPRRSLFSRIRSFFS